MGLAGVGCVFFAVASTNGCSGDDDTGSDDAAPIVCKTIDVDPDGAEKCTQTWSGCADGKSYQVICTSGTCQCSGAGSTKSFSATYDCGQGDNIDIASANAGCGWNLK